ncbi:hypothetical protein ACP70R_043890 [Stipagrostis hirtigluma subsp. patula]
MEAMLHEGSEVIRSGHKIIRAKRELHELENYINYASFLVAGGIRDPELLYYWINKAQEAAFSLEDVISMYEIWPNRRYKLHAMKSETNESGSLIKELAEIIKECTKRITEQERNSDIKARPYETSRNMPAEVDNSEIMVLLSEISLFIRYSHPVTADKVLGMDSETEQLKRLLRGNDPVLFVIGGQGSGKTTLMKIVYEDPDVKNDFPARSWVDAAKVTGLVDLLRKMLKVKRSDAEPAADATDELGIMSEIHTTDPDAIDELKIMTEIHSIIQDKRYLVVLDNVQDTCALQTLKQVLKECNGKIICLTRNQDINMEQVPEVTISGLETKEARKLFIRAAFPRFLDSTAEENATFLSALQWTADKYPSLGINASEVGPTLAKDLEDALDRCGGNPWNIWTLGTLLEANPYKWEDILGEQGMDNVLIDVKTGEGKGKQKAEKGYTNWQSLDPPQKKSDPPIQLEDAKLPPDIRRGFLYCLAFPETSGIPARKLIRLWVAEGFVQDRLLHRQEQEAESLLQKLIDKKLLVVKREGSDGEVLECSVNENIRPLASTMCELQKFCRFVPEKQHPAHQYSCSTPKSESWLLYISQLTQKSKIMEKDKKFTYTSTTAGHRQLNQKSKMTGKFTSTSITPCYRCRMLAVHGDEGVEDALRTLYRHDRLRSLLYFGTGRMQRSKFDLSFKGRYNLLRTLELQGASLAFLPPSIQVLVCLRYLGLRNTPLEDLPASLHKLNKLMCLDIRDTGITSVDVFAFEEMRHLYLANSFRGQSVRASPGLGLLIDLRTLSGAAYTKALEEELSYLELLRKLSIKKVPPTSSQNVCHAINNMEFLQSLTITCEEGQLDISSLNTGKNLRKLKLGGDMGALCDRRLTMMQSITYLYLWDSKLTDDPLLRLQGLQHLLLLCLHNAYTGQKLRCENGYRKLKKLSIISIENLNECTFGSGAMKSLEELVFAKCYKISSPPQGIEHITSLQVVKWSEMPLGFSNGLNTGSIKRRARVEEIKMHYHRSTRAATEADPALRSDLGAQDTTQDTKSGDGTAVRVDLKRPSPTAGLTPYSRPDRGRPARLRLDSHLIQEMRKTPDVPYAFLDPQHMIISQIERDRQGAVDYLAKSISHYMDKRFIMVPHNTGGHWVLLVICPMWDMVCYMDSLMRPLDEDGKPKERDYTFVRGVLNDAFAEFLATHPELNKEKNHELKHMTEFACHQQPASNLCGFFVAKNMLLTTGAKDIKYPDDFIFDTRNTEDNSVLYHIRDAIASFLVSEVIDKNGEFHYPDNNHPASVTILSGPHPEGSSSHNKDVKPRREEREAHDIAIKDAPAARVTETFASNGQQHSTDDKSSMSSQHDLADHKNSSSSRSKDEMDGDRT